MDVTCILGPSIAQSLNFFRAGLCSSSVTAALALMTVSTQLLLMDKINFTLNVVCLTIWSFMMPVDSVVSTGYTAPL